jgi:hypothetical protein
MILIWSKIIFGVWENLAAKNPELSPIRKYGNLKAERIVSRNLKFYKFAECYATLRVFKKKFRKKIAQKNLTFFFFFLISEFLKKNIFWAILVPRPIWSMLAKIWGSSPLVGEEIENEQTVEMRKSRKPNNSAVWSLPCFQANRLMF